MIKNEPTMCDIEDYGSPEKKESREHKIIVNLVILSGFLLFMIVAFVYFYDLQNPLIDSFEIVKNKQ